MAAGEILTASPTEKRLDLVRALGAWASGAIVVGTMIGTGIFLKPAEMAREGRFVSVVFAAWIVGAILSLFGALSFAELGAMLPEAGGEYAYLRRGFGPVWGFLFGWMHSIVGRPSSASSIAAGLVRFLGFLLPAVATPIFTLHIAIPGLTSWLRPYDFVFTWAQPLAVLWLAIMTGVNYLGVRLGGAVQVFLTAIKIISVVIVIGVAFFSPTPSPHPTPKPATRPDRRSDRGRPPCRRGRPLAPATASMPLPRATAGRRPPSSRGPPSPPASLCSECGHRRS